MSTASAAKEYSVLKSIKPPDARIWGRDAIKELRDRLIAATLAALHRADDEVQKQN
jgi:hypothetical protein